AQAWSEWSDESITDTEPVWLRLALTLPLSIPIPAGFAVKVPMRFTLASWVQLLFVYHETKYSAPGSSPFSCALTAVCARLGCSVKSTVPAMPVLANGVKSAFT